MQALFGLLPGWLGQIRAEVPVQASWDREEAALAAPSRKMH